MREYDRNQPLIIIHEPKTAGTSAKQLFQQWFGAGFFTNYPSEEGPPKKLDLFSLHSTARPIALYGHFNKGKHFGIEDFYPGVNQFITILRDPFEQALSRYFFIKKQRPDSWIFRYSTIEDYLIHEKSIMFDHFPREVTFTNYRDIFDEYFIEVGITEFLEDSLKWIAVKLGKTYDGSLLGHHNATSRNEDVSSHLREVFIERNPLEFTVYAHALQKFTAQGTPPDSTSLHP